MRDPVQLTRRTTLATASGLVVLVGGGLLGACDDRAGPRSAPSTRPPSARGSAAATDPDAAIVDRAVARVGEVSTYLALVSRRLPRLAPKLAPLVALHRAHRRALGVTAPPPGPAASLGVPRSARRALAEVTREENQLSDQLASLAGEAASGALARLLASMAAAVHQHVAAPGEPDRLPSLAPHPHQGDDEVPALQQTLAAEYAAVYVYGVLGAQTSQSDPVTAPLFAALGDAYGVHLARRDELVAAVIASGATPVTSAAAYVVPRRLDRRRVVERTAHGMEAGLASTYAYLVAQTTAETRRWAVATLRDTAVRELAFRGTPETFPGAVEFADR